MVNNDQAPLDSDEVISDEEIKSTPSASKKRLRFVLELIPLSFITLSLVLKYYEHPFWMQTLVIGGTIAAFLYMFFSWFLFRVEEYHLHEVVLSVICGLIFPFGLMALFFKMNHWEMGEEMITFSIYGGMGMCFVSILFFVVNLRNRRASIFYRNLMIRLLVFTVILLRLYPEF